ncbi:LIM domain-containing protein [Pontiella sp. NLcol2]|uniref:LIM domain-containing protein n=2 Tax=Pontiella agarivorans TaxID=3038953 RepID=A0ABU5MZ46_9BACT|nr:LIM domain-containing protein [Pontiella agarivorans]
MLSALQILFVLPGTKLLADENPTVCEVCGETLPGRYWNYEGHACCSQQCVDKLRPKCAKCGRPINGQYIESEGKIYCSKKCFNSTLPRCEICGAHIESGYSITRHNYCDECMSNSPTCFSCGLPAKDPTELSDGRIVCSTCRRWSVYTDDAALEQYDRARRELETWTGLQLRTIPQLKLVNRTEMEELSGTIRKTDEPVTIRGLYSRQTMLVKRGIFGSWRKNEKQSTESVYIVNHLHEEIFRVAAVHELMHDMVHEHFPKLEDAPLWVHEGISQFAAAEYCRKKNYLDALDTIETSKDPDYGDGYRFFNDIAGFKGWNALKQWIEEVDVSSLPKKAPLE